VSTVFFAIRQISTGHFMPSYSSRKGRGGYTHDEPQPLAKVPPRLFTKRHVAQRVLNYWLKGSITQHFSRVHTLEGPDDHEYLNVTKIPHRRAEDMEVVAIFLTAWQMTPSGCLSFEVKT